MTETPRFNPAAGYTAHDHALDAPSALAQLFDAAPELRAALVPALDSGRGGLGAARQWDGDRELDLTPDRAPTGPCSVGLSAGAAGTVTLDDLRRQARARRSNYAADIDSAELERAREAVKNGADPADVEPIDAT